jgi:hypothetical protein
MSKNCIFNQNKVCNNCGECNVCEFDGKKICDNCGKCLEIEGYDLRAIKIEEVFEKKEDSKLMAQDLEDNNRKENEEEIKIDTKVLSIANEDNICEDVEKEYSKIKTKSDDIMDHDDMWEYIDDVRDLSEILNDDTLFKNIAHEKFPGMIVLNKENKK